MVPIREFGEYPILNISDMVGETPIWQFDFLDTINLKIDCKI